MYIIASSGIHAQPVFENPGFSAKLLPLGQQAPLQHPDYSRFIPLKDTRRMNDVIKMAITCAGDCLAQAGLEQPQAIIVGTSMGCNEFTKAFLDKINAAGTGLIPPTAFMLSTHNSIASQISLFLGNKNYNMTHTQGSLSFEHALIDAWMCIKEGYSPVLAGAADEMENALYSMEDRLSRTDLNLTSGTSFFLLSDTPRAGASIQIKKCFAAGLLDEPLAATADFLKDSGVLPEKISRVWYSVSDDGQLQAMKKLMPSAGFVDFQPYSGVYFTHTGFALHLATDFLLNHSEETDCNVLIYNNLVPENLGLVLLSNLHETD